GRTTVPCNVGRRAPLTSIATERRRRTNAHFPTYRAIGRRRSVRRNAARRRLLRRRGRRTNLDRPAVLGRRRRSAAPRAVDLAHLPVRWQAARGIDGHVAV